MEERAEAMELFDGDDHCESICQRIRMSLSHATTVVADDCSYDDGQESTPASVVVSRCAKTMKKISLICGHASYSSNKKCWQVRHRSTANVTPSHTGVLGAARSDIDTISSNPSFSAEDAIASTAPAPATWVASLVYNKNNDGKEENDDNIMLSSSPPLELVQSILRAAEFRTMLQQVKASIPERLALSAAELPRHPLRCISRVQDEPTIDLSPIITKIISDQCASAWESCDDEIGRRMVWLLLDHAIRCSSKFISRMWDGWQIDQRSAEKENWHEVDDEPSSYITSDTIAAIQSFSRCCLQDGPRIISDDSPNQIRSVSHPKISILTSSKGCTTNDSLGEKVDARKSQHKDLSTTSQAGNHLREDVCHDRHPAKMRRRKRSNLEVASDSLIALSYDESSTTKAAREASDRYFSRHQTPCVDIERSRTTKDKVDLLSAPRHQNEDEDLTPVVSPSIVEEVETQRLNFHSGLQRTNPVNGQQPKGIVSGESDQIDERSEQTESSNEPSREIIALKSEHKGDIDDVGSTKMRDNSTSHHSEEYQSNSKKIASCMGIKNDPIIYKKAASNEIIDSKVMDSWSEAKLNAGNAAQEGSVSESNCESSACTLPEEPGSKKRKTEHTADTGENRGRLYKTKPRTSRNSDEDQRLDMQDSSASQSVGSSGASCNSKNVLRRRSPRKRERIEWKEEEFHHAGFGSPRVERSDVSTFNANCDSAKRIQLPVDLDGGRQVVKKKGPRAEEAADVDDCSRNSKDDTRKANRIFSGTAVRCKSSPEPDDQVKQKANAGCKMPSTSAKRKRSNSGNDNPERRIKQSLETSFSQREMDGGMIESHIPDYIHLNAKLTTNRGIRSSRLNDLVHATERHWFNLSYIGLISDYHGLHRKFDSFLPLRFEKTLRAYKDSILKTLEGVKDEGDISDEDVALDNEDYARSIQSYIPKVDKERARRKKERALKTLDVRKTLKKRRKSDAAELEAMLSRSIQFDTETFGEVVHQNKCSHKSCSLCFPQLDDTELCPSLKQPSFRMIDEDEIVSTIEECGNTGRRRSRTAQLKGQRKWSVMILTEMLHTLEFIEKFNKGLIDNMDDIEIPAGLGSDGSENEGRDTFYANKTGWKVLPMEQTKSSKIQDLGNAGFETASIGRAHDSRKEHPCMRPPNHRPLRSSQRSKIDYTEVCDDEVDGRRHKQIRKSSQRVQKSFFGERDKDGDQEAEGQELSFATRHSLHSTEVKQIASPHWVKLSYIGLLSDYHGLQRKFDSFSPLPTHASLAELKNILLASLIDDEDGQKIDFADEEATAENKIYQRVTKGYRDKADQERIEKQEHEEKRKLAVREYEYRNRRTKKTWEELERQELESRRVCFSVGSRSNDARRKACKLGGKDCALCFNTREESQMIESIYSPKFRKIEDDTAAIIENEIRAKGGRRSRTAELVAQKSASAMVRSELFHSLEFIEKHNEGLIRLHEKQPQKIR